MKTKILQTALISTMVLSGIGFSQVSHAENTTELNKTTINTKATKEAGAVENVKISASDFKVKVGEDLSKWTTAQWKENLKLTIIDDAGVDHSTEYLESEQFKKGIADIDTSIDKVITFFFSYTGTDNKTAKKTVDITVGEGISAIPSDMPAKLTLTGSNVRIKKTTDKSAAIAKIKKDMDLKIKASYTGTGEAPTAFQKALDDITVTQQEGLDQQLDAILQGIKSYDKTGTITIKASSWLIDEKGKEIVGSRVDLQTTVEVIKDGKSDDDAIINNPGLNVNKQFKTIASKDGLSNEEIIKNAGVKIIDADGKEITDSIDPKTLIKSNNVDWEKVGTYTITFEYDGKTQDTKVIVEAQTPEIAASNVKISKTETNEAKSQDWTKITNAKATDSIDGDLTSKITWDYSQVDTAKSGKYTLVGTVKNENGGEATSKITVTVTGSNDDNSNENKNENSNENNNGNIDNNLGNDGLTPTNNTGNSSNSGTNGTGTTNNNTNSGTNGTNGKNGTGTNAVGTGQLSQTDQTFDPTFTIIGASIMAVAGLFYKFLKRKEIK